MNEIIDWDEFRNDLDRKLWISYALPETQYDEPYNIPFGQGTEEGHTAMWEKVRAMSEQELKLAWEALDGFSGRNYYDRANGIGMTDWANCVASMMDTHGIPHFA